MINEIIALYSQNKSVQKIEIEDLSWHIYDILLNKFWAETACSILSTKLNDISKQAFILYEPNLSACINIDIWRLNQELKKYNVSESSFFTNGVKKHSQIIGLLIFFFIIIFFIFVVFKKK
jgi:ATP-dependent Zn protease